MSIKPFKLKLKKVKAAESGFVDLLFGLMNNLGFSGDIKTLFQETVLAQTTLELKIDLESYQLLDSDDFSYVHSEQFFCAMLTAMPQDLKIFVQADSSLALLLVERLLGGASGEIPSPRQLSEIELGVFQYLLLQLLSKIHLNGDKKGTRFILDKFIKDDSAIVGYFKKNDCVLLTYRVSAGSGCGFVKIMLPFGLLEKGMGSRLTSAEMSKDDFEKYLNQLGSYGYINTTLWAEAGRSVVSNKDCSNLDEGDVVVFDQTELESEKPSGRVLLRIGDGLTTGIMATLEAKKDSISCKLEEMV